MAENFELGNRVDRRLENESTVHGADIVGAVDQEIIRFRPLAVDSIGLILSRRAASFEKARGQGHDAGLKQSQLRKVAAVQREVEDLVLHHRLPETADRALHQRRIRAHFNLLRFRPELEANADRGSLIHLQRDSLLHVLLETSRLDL